MAAHVITNTKLEMIAGHLNAPAGLVVRAEHLAQALRQGTVTHVEAGAQTSLVRGLLHTVFVEITPELILAASREAGGNWMLANRLYEESVVHGLPHVPSWERAVRDWQ